MPPTQARTRRAATTGIAIAIILAFASASPAHATPHPAQASTDMTVAAVSPAAASSSTTSGCRSTSKRYPWGKSAVRTWTPTNAQPGAGTVDNPGITQGAPFKARLVSSHGRDTSISKEIVILEKENGCRIQTPSISFTPSDRAQISKARKAHPPKPDTAAYALWFDPAHVTQEHVDNGAARVHQTQHFAIWSGVDTSAFSYRWQSDHSIDWDQGVDTFGKWMEEVWLNARDVGGAPMPYATEVDKRKINIYLCGTGLPYTADTEDCGAQAGAKSIFVSAPYILDGSSTMVHEFTHTLSEFTGGFAGGHPGVDTIWETQANFMSGTIGSYFNIWYYQNLENGPTWRTNWYGSFPLLMHLYEDDDTRSLVWRAWQQNARNGDGGSKEEFLQTVVRLGQTDGVYQQGWRSFADDLGWYGARLAANDFPAGKVFADTMTYSQEGSRFVGLNPTQARSGYSSPIDRPLWQFGTHLIPLTSRADAQSVTVTLKGQTSSATASWRYALVSIDASGNPVYSALGSATSSTSGTTITLAPSKARKLFLAVTATPGTYEILGVDDQPTPTPKTFPYTVSLTGAAPTLPGAGTCLGPFQTDGVANLNWKTNGNFAWDQSCRSVGPSVSIPAQPQDQKVSSGQAATFKATVAGSALSKTQWQMLRPGSKTWTNLTGTRTAVKVGPGTPDGTLIRIIAHSTDGALVASRSARLNVTP